MEYFDTEIKKKPSWIFLRLLYCKNAHARKQLSNLQYPRMGDISSKFPGGSMILPLLNNFVFLRPINSINYCKWFTLAKKSTEISGGNQSLLNLNLSCFVNSIFSLVRSYICLSCCYPYILNFTNIHQHYQFFLSVSLFDSGIRIWFNETH